MADGPCFARPSVGGEAWLRSPGIFFIFSESTCRPRRFQVTICPSQSFLSEVNWEKKVVFLAALSDPIYYVRLMGVATHEIRVKAQG